MTEAWVTLATNDTYALGALVLAQSLRRVKTDRTLHCMVTPGVTDGMRAHLASVFDVVSGVDVLDSEDAENLALIKRADLGITFTKLNCWRLTQYRKCVFLDADTLVLQNADELFECEEFSAAPDIGWPDMFNSGVYVFEPSIDSYRALLQFALTHGSFDGGDQGLLNDYFHDWREKSGKFRLSFKFNMSSNAIYTYAAAYKKFGKDVRIVHFLGSVKPWHHSFTESGLHYRDDSQHLHSHIAHWWQVFFEDVQKLLAPEYSVSHYCRLPLTRTYRVSCPHAPPQPSPDTVAASNKATVKFDTTVVTYTRSETEPFTAPQPLAPSTLTGGRTVPAVRSARRPRRGDHYRVRPAVEAPKQHQADSGPYKAKISQLPVAPKQRVYRCELRPLNSQPDVPSCVKYGYSTGEEGPKSKAVSLSKKAQAPEPDLSGPTAAWRRRQGRKQVAGAAAACTVTSKPDNLAAHKLLSESQPTPRTGGLTGPAPKVSEAVAASPKTEMEHRRAWEAGHVEYLGRDSWENIQKRLDQSLGLE